MLGVQPHHTGPGGARKTNNVIIFLVAFNGKTREDLYHFQGKGHKARHTAWPVPSLHAKWQAADGKTSNVTQKSILIGAGIDRGFFAGCRCIMDCNGGSNSFSVAALLVGMDVVTVEINQRQYDGALARIIHDSTAFTTTPSVPFDLWKAMFAHLQVMDVPSRAVVSASPSVVRRTVSQASIPPTEAAFQVHTQPSFCSAFPSLQAPLTLAASTPVASPALPAVEDDADAEAAMTAVLAAPGD
jgi:hypothetical protein